MNKLPPSEFRFGNYNAGIPFDVYMDDCLLIGWLTVKAVGYCREPGTYRYREDQVAVMFDLEDDGRYWSHIPDYVFDEFMELI